MMDGFINVLKPPGMSSGAVVGLVKRVTGAKVGHAGTLDPEASGILPIMMGKATRLFDFLVEKQKTYLAEIAFGTATDTQDAQGMVIARGDNYPTLEALEKILPQFIGTVMQRPPMFSALKKDGQPLYKLARKGEEVEIPARPIEIFGITVTAQTPNHGFMIRIQCGKGTYIRTLCHDIGEALGCPAHMRFLLREQTGPFDLSTAVTIEALKASKDAGNTHDYVLPMDYPLSHIMRHELSQWTAHLFENGVALRPGQWPGAEEGTSVRLYYQNHFMGISRAEADGTLRSSVVLSKQEGST